MLLLFGLLRKRLHHCLAGDPRIAIHRSSGGPAERTKNNRRLEGWNKPVPEKPTLGWEAPTEENNVPFSPALRLFPLPPSKPDLSTAHLRRAAPRLPLSKQASGGQAGTHCIYIYYACI